MSEIHHVQVDDAIYHCSFTEKYIDYRIFYNDGARIWRIRRRFSDFVKLRESLLKHEPMLLLPQLPTYHIYTLWDRCNPKLIKERSVRLRLFLEHLLSANPHHPILGSFLKQDQFQAIPLQSHIPDRRIEVISQDEACELHRTIQSKLKTIKYFSDRLLHLRRSIKIYKVFWDASLTCGQGLADAIKLFAQARSDSSQASCFNEVASKLSRERVLIGDEDASAYCTSDEYLIDHYLGLIESLFGLFSKGEESRRVWLSAKDSEIDATTEVRLSLFDEAKDFEKTHSKITNNKKAKEIAEEKLRAYGDFLQSIHRSIIHFEKQYSQDISLLISCSTNKIRASLSESIQIWHENGHEINLTDNMDWR